MGYRRQSREQALQALFYMDKRYMMVPDSIDLYCEAFPPGKNSLSFFLELTYGVIDNRRRIDTLIEGYSSHWKMTRMSCVDRNVMRIAVYEMLFCEDIPVMVSINEAIDIGKKFGTDESGAFINGILDSIRKAVDIKKKTANSN